MRTEIKEFLESIAPKWRSRKIKENSEYVEWIAEKYPSYNLNEGIAFILQDLDSEPLCPICSGKLNDIRKTTCSYSCSAALLRQNGTYNERNEKAKATMIKKYGTENPFSHPDIVQKRHSTMMDRYGMLVSSKSLDSIKNRASDLNTKGRKTLKEKYGVDNPSQLPDHQAKVKQSLLDRYGVEHYALSDEARAKSLKKKLDVYEKLALDRVHIDSIVDPSQKKLDTYDNPNSIVAFTCNDCGISESLPSETFKYRARNFGTPCGVCCGSSTKGSAAEKEIVDYVKSIYNGTVLENDRTVIAPKELDIVLPELEVAIEYCGLYWHNDIRKDKKYHHEKLLLAREQGYQLITIFEDEWIHKKNIVKARLKHKLVLDTEQKIYARKCIVQEIDASTAKNFVDNNHIQGYVNSKYKLGLYHNDELVSVMCFSKSNASKGNSNGLELTRFCVHKDKSVVGAAGKLFKYFINNFDYNEIFSYSDLRWNTGNVYKQIGMKFDKFTGVNYWYTDTKLCIRKHRYSLRKNKSDNQSLTEWENRKLQGYDRIWDCGNEKYIWKRDE